MPAGPSAIPVFNPQAICGAAVQENAHLAACHCRTTTRAEACLQDVHLTAQQHRLNCVAGAAAKQSWSRCWAAARQAPNRQHRILQALHAAVPRNAVLHQIGAMPQRHGHAPFSPYAATKSQRPPLQARHSRAADVCSEEPSSPSSAGSTARACTIRDDDPRLFVTFETPQQQPGQDPPAGAAQPPAPPPLKVPLLQLPRRRHAPLERRRPLGIRCEGRGRDRHTPAACGPGSKAGLAGWLAKLPRGEQQHMHAGGVQPASRFKLRSREANTSPLLLAAGPPQPPPAGFEQGMGDQRATGRTQVQGTALQ